MGSSYDRWQYFSCCDHSFWDCVDFLSHLFRWMQTFWKGTQSSLDGRAFQCFILYRDCLRSSNRFSSRLGFHWYACNNEHRIPCPQNSYCKNLWDSFLWIDLPFNRGVHVSCGIFVYYWNDGLCKHANNNCCSHSSPNGVSFEVKRDPSECLLSILFGKCVFLFGHWCPLQPIHFIIFHCPSFLRISYRYLLLKVVFVGDLEEIYLLRLLGSQTADTCNFGFGSRPFLWIRHAAFLWTWTASI